MASDGISGLAAVARLILERDLARLRGAQNACIELTVRRGELAGARRAALADITAPPRIAAQFCDWARTRSDEIDAALVQARALEAGLRTDAQTAFGRHQALVDLARTLDAARREERARRAIAG